MLFLPCVVKAQSGELVEVRDFETWNSVGIEYKLNKKWDFGLQQQLRLENNSSELKNYFTQMEAQYELFKNFKLGLGLRYINVNDNKGAIQGMEQYFRYQLDASFGHKLKRFKLNYRLRYQNKRELFLESYEVPNLNQAWRFRLKLDYNIRSWKIDPYLAGELFNTYQDGQNNGLTDYRLILGANYNLKIYGKLGVFYGIENELTGSYPKTTNIVRIKYTYILKNK
jgi:hypothetical protein